ncbi:UNVERIFIED_CONTAM: hypothetical protein FKN15_021898 [Acipenser sinensis]
MFRRNGDHFQNATVKKNFSGPFQRPFNCGEHPYSPSNNLTWDRNGTSAQGLLDVARALDHNFTLQFMPVPLSDVTQAYRSAPERTEEALHKIQRSLLRNNQSQRFSQQQAFRLHQGIVTSTTEQVNTE